MEIMMNNEIRISKMIKRYFLQDIREQQQDNLYEFVSVNPLISY